jgi:hypothetical protein
MVKLDHEPRNTVSEPRAKIVKEMSAGLTADFADETDDEEIIRAIRAVRG